MSITLPDVQQLGEFQPNAVQQRPEEGLAQAVSYTPGIVGAAQSQAADETKSALDKLQDLHNDAVARDASNQFMNAATDLDTKFKSEPNQMAAIPVYQAKYQAMQQQLGANMPLEAQEKFLNDSSGYMGYVHRQMAGDAAQQYQKSIDKTFETTMQLALQNPNAPGSRQNYIDASVNRAKNSAGDNPEMLANTAKLAEKDFGISLLANKPANEQSQIIKPIADWLAGGGVSDGTPKDMGADTVKPYSAKQVSDMQALVAKPSQFDPLFEKAHAAYPDVAVSDLKLHAAAESSMNPNAVFKDKDGNIISQGLMGIATSNNSKLGVTDPTNAEQSIMAAAKLMHENGATTTKDADLQYYGGKNGQGPNSQQYAENLAAVRGSGTSGSTPPPITIDGHPYNIQPEKAMQIYESAQTKLAQQNAATRAQYDINLDRGTLTRPQLDDAYNKGIYTPAEYTRATAQMDKQQQDKIVQINATQQVNNALIGNGYVDTTDKDQVAAANDIYSGIVNNQGNAPSLDLKLNLAGRMGFIPDDLMAEIKGGMNSGDPQKVQDSMNTILTMQGSNPVLASKISKPDTDMALTLKDYMDRGMSLPNAMDMYAKSQNVPQAQKDERSKIFDTQYANFDATNFIKEQNTPKGILPAIGRALHFSDQTPDVPPVMAADFMRNWRDEMLRNGSPDAAKQIALADTNRVWGVSAVGTTPEEATGPVTAVGLDRGLRSEPIGTRRYMPYAPENFYGVPGGIDNAKWINEQMVDDVQKYGKSLDGSPIDASTLMVSPTFSQHNGKPTYFISRVNDQGIIEPVFGKDNQQLEWHPDWASSKEKQRLDTKPNYYMKAIRGAGAVGKSLDFYGDSD